MNVVTLRPVVNRTVSTMMEASSVSANQDSDWKMMASHVLVGCHYTREFHFGFKFSHWFQIFTLVFSIGFRVFILIIG